MLGIPYEALSLGGNVKFGWKDYSRIFELTDGEPFELQETSNYRHDTHNVHLFSEIDDALESFSHEWFHALDGLLALGKDYDQKARVSEHEAVMERGLTTESMVPTFIRKEVLEAIRGINEAISDSTFAKDSKERGEQLDDVEYWASPAEMAARAFNGYLLFRMNGNGKNSYSSEEAETRMLPDLNDASTKTIFSAFDKLFRTLRVGTNESTGRATLYRMGQTDGVRYRMAPPPGVEVVSLPKGSSVSAGEVKSGLREFAEGWKRRKGLVYGNEQTLNKILAGAERFIDLYFGKTVTLPNGGIMRFSPDARAVERLGSERAAWQEYAIHAATNDVGKKRTYNSAKVAMLGALQRIVSADKAALGSGGVIFTDDGKRAVTAKFTKDGELLFEELRYVTHSSDFSKKLKRTAPLSDIATRFEEATPVADNTSSTEDSKAQGASAVKPADGTRYRMGAEDSDYLEAVNDGDTQAARRMVQDAALEAGAMEDSDGYPFMLYHGSPNTFNVFNEGGGLIWATPERFYASKYGDVRMPLYAFPEKVLDVGEINSPLRNGDGSPSDGAAALAEKLGVSAKTIVELGLENDNASHKDELWAVTSAQGFRKLLEDAGYDMVMATEGDVLTFGALRSSQYKSADAVTRDDAGNVIPLSERFSGSSDVRYRLGNEGGPEAQMGGVGSFDIEGSLGHTKNMPNGTQSGKEGIYGNDNGTWTTGNVPGRSPSFETARNRNEGDGVFVHEGSMAPDGGQKGYSKYLGREARVEDFKRFGFGSFDDRSSAGRTGKEGNAHEGESHLERVVIFWAAM